MKKCLPTIFTAILTVSVLAGCADQRNQALRNPSSEQSSAAVQNSAAVQSRGSAMNQTGLSTNGASSPTASPDVSAAYEKLMAYKTEDYGQQSVADFNATLASTPDELTVFLSEMADVISAISPDDENYDFFMTTMSFSSHELYCEHMGEEFAFFISPSKQSRLCDYLDDEGEPVYEFNCFVDANVVYSINDSKLVTVAERDHILLTFEEEMQNYLDGLSEAECTDGNIKERLADKAAELANRLSTENMQLSSCEICMIGINGAEEAARQ